MNPSIKTEGLSFKYGKTAAVANLQLSVPQGSIYAILGPNGAGKTTTIKLLLNLLQPTAGQANVLGTVSTKLGAAELAQIGYVSENQELPEWMTVRQLIEFCRPMYPTWDPAFCAKMVVALRLPLERKLRELSRGMRMKVSLLVALAYRPRLLILDEPFTGLDPVVRNELIRGILELTEQENWSVFISSHDIEDVERMADWIGFIDRGVLRVSESTASLSRRFKRLDCVISSETRLPVSIPGSWMIPEKYGQRFSVVESAFVEGESERRLAEVLPTAADICVTDLSLREIYLTLAQHSELTP